MLSERHIRERALCSDSGVGRGCLAIGIAAVVWRSFTVGARTCTNGAWGGMRGHGETGGEGAGQQE